MKVFIYFSLLLLLLLAFGYLVYLNRTPVELVLTPESNGEYYRIPPMPLGFLVIGALFLGFLFGYLIAWLTSLKR
jgi:1,4-dihydroxy-2-naphthoate octaprenyltransferase